MSAQVLGFTGSAHRDAFELLPWLVNGTLDATERAWVERHVQDCPACRRECAWLRQIAGACGQDEVVVDADAAFARLAGRLTDDDAPAGSLQDEAPHGRGTASPRTSSVLRAWLGSRGAWLRFGLAMQFGVIVALGWMLVAGVPPQYRTLAAKQATANGAGNIIVVFDSATPEHELRRILRDAGARIVDGPTVTGAYVLDVAGTPQGRGAALARLRAERAVTLAEPLMAEPAR